MLSVWVCVCVYACVCGATGPTDGDIISIGESCEKTNANPNPICAIPAGLDHGVCRNKEYDDCVIALCQSGQPGAFCGQTSVGLCCPN